MTCERTELEKAARLAAVELADYMGCDGFNIPMGDGRTLVFARIECVDSLSGAAAGREVVANAITAALAAGKGESNDGK